MKAPRRALLAVAAVGLLGGPAACNLSEQRDPDDEDVRGAERALPQSPVTGAEAVDVEGKIDDSEAAEPTSGEIGR